MVKIEIDNKKMWASLMEQCALSDNPSVMKFYYLIRRALKKQGFDINSETNEIVSIEPEQFRPELGRWYYCFKSWHNREMYHNGGIYKAVINTHFDDVALLSDDGNSYPWDCKEVFEQYFRPATEEEILKAKYGITGIGSKKAEGKLGEMISQRMESAKAKEALLPDRELSEFEKAVQQTISSYLFLPHDIDHCVQREDAFNFYKKAASCLLSIAYKKFIEEACEWLEENLINYWSQAYTDNCDFIEDFRKALEKGD